MWARQAQQQQNTISPRFASQSHAPSRELSDGLGRFYSSSSLSGSSSSLVSPSGSGPASASASSLDLRSVGVGYSRSNSNGLNGLGLGSGLGGGTSSSNNGGGGGAGNGGGGHLPRGAQLILTPSGRALAIGGRVRNVSQSDHNPVMIFWPDNEPLPEAGQIRPALPFGYQQPPILNTGNKGAMEIQAGDWHCLKCELSPCVATVYYCGLRAAAVSRTFVL
ncbi:hypothetical protein BOTBODRAFT_225037 [Botryobasidium botryosum FD-172 SS1]|uniref:Uncharacterized protein n=1 Tax=Botryobasidium botryosum (strain FD-172 SS1) TaxID=930990 RepID=A0A067MMU7_BOTB1|nr:hypothetical protein BOTBODRAFT_225037 [Botryobasidium botryosum FD-172 SS1]